MTLFVAKLEKMEDGGKRFGVNFVFRRLIEAENDFFRRMSFSTTKKFLLLRAIIQQRVSAMLPTPSST